jgi:hypothetical protein
VTVAAEVNFHDGEFTEVKTVGAEGIEKEESDLKTDESI